jgi:hypothetical protein
MDFEQKTITHQDPALDISDGHQFKIFGRVTAKLDDEIIVQQKPNHFVNAGLKGFVGWLSCATYQATSVVVPTGVNIPSSITGFNEGCLIRVGSNTSTATVNTATALASAYGTDPLVVSSTDGETPSSGYWRTRRTAVFAVGAITGAIGEMALYHRPIANTGNAHTYSPGTAPPLAMVSRISVADGDFEVFTPASTQSLGIEWELGITW